jgi:hypothetical protein
MLNELANPTAYRPPRRGFRYIVRLSPQIQPPIQLEHDGRYSLIFPPVPRRDECPGVGSVNGDAPAELRAGVDQRLDKLAV